MLTLIKDLGIIKGDRKRARRFGLYKCECGKEKVIVMYNVNNGHVKSCGCAQLYNGAITHGLRKHPLYSVWCNIKARCSDANRPDYERYGGRGVRICDEWENNFKAFYDWCISNGWERGMEVDKDIKSISLGIPAILYSPDFCSIVSRIKNNNNKRNIRYITINGITKNITEWTKVYDINISTVYSRISKGWSEESAIITPKIKKTA